MKRNHEASSLSEVTGRIGLSGVFYALGLKLIYILVSHEVSQYFSVELHTTDGSIEERVPVYQGGTKTFGLFLYCCA